MRSERFAWPCLICLLMAVTILALPGGSALAGSEEHSPAGEALATPEASRPAPQLPGETAAAASPEPAVATPEAVEGVPVVVDEGALTPGLLPNPCYQFDNPSIGCYYKWRPSDLCCISPAPWCPAICY